jgi:phosphopantothenoylcysteine decarboxylase/phosphopantothenate--cysteine ligase
MKVLITAGTTHEHIDPVRFISNASSGLQGVLLAETAIRNGHNVTLIIGPNSLNVEKYFKDLLNQINQRRCEIALPPIKSPINIINIVSAEDMYKAAMEHFPSCDIAICSAAVGDYRVKNIAKDKIKRNGDSILLELIPNPDIAKSLGEIKTDKQTLIGFALETSNGIENAKSKIIKKNLDWVVLNESTKDNPSFGTDTNIVSFINKSGTMQSHPKLDKKEIAQKILDLVK